MGVFKKHIFRENTTTLREQLIKRGGFYNGTGANGYKGLCTKLDTDKGIRYWIVVNLETNLLFIYSETNDCIHLWNKEYIIMEKHLESFESIINFIDDKI